MLRSRASFYSTYSPSLTGSRKYRPIEEDGQGNVKCYNDELEMYSEDEKRWFTMNWLFAECYLSIAMFLCLCHMTDGAIGIDGCETTLR